MTVPITLPDQRISILKIQALEMKNMCANMIRVIVMIVMKAQIATNAHGIVSFLAMFIPGLMLGGLLAVRLRAVRKRTVTRVGYHQMAFLRMAIASLLDSPAPLRKRNRGAGGLP